MYFVVLDIKFVCLCIVLIVIIIILELVDVKSGKNVKFGYRLSVLFNWSLL